MEQPFLEACPPPNNTHSPEDALNQCIAFTNYHVLTNIAFPVSFIRRAHKLYVNEVERHHILDAATRHVSNDPGSIPFRYPKPLSFYEFLDELGPEVQGRYWHYQRGSRL